jgi:hypothetical protein
MFARRSASLESVLSALGWGYVPVPALQTLPPDLAGELTTLALKLGASMPETVKALIDIGVEQKLLRMNVEEKRAVLAEQRAIPATPQTTPKPAAAARAPLKGISNRADKRLRFSHTPTVAWFTSSPSNASEKTGPVRFICDAPAIFRNGHDD